MIIHVSSPEERSINRWLGGTTTELYIHPKSATYAKKDFDFRISIATVEVEESIFTPLPEVSRTTLVLEGETILTHEEHHSKQLKKFDSDMYDGSWNTSSLGMSTNFNLMTRGKVSSTIKHRVLEEKEFFELNPKGKDVMQFIYIYTGEVLLSNEKLMQSLSAGSLVSFESFSEKMSLEAKCTIELLIIDLIL